MSFWKILQVPYISLGTELSCNIKNIKHGLNIFDLYHKFEIKRGYHMIYIIFILKKAYETKTKIKPFLQPSYICKFFGIWNFDRASTKTLWMEKNKVMIENCLFFSETAWNPSKHKWYIFIYIFILFVISS